MKNTARIVTLSALTCIAAQAAPFLAVGDNAELFVTASAAVKFDDNIYLNPSNEQDDTIFSFTPGVDLVFGKGAAASGNVYYREEIRRYTDADIQNTELSDIGARLNYNNGLTKGSFNATYAQLAQNDITAGVGAIVRRKLTNVGGDLEFSLSEKTSLGVGSSFIKTDYGPASYTDSDVWTTPLDLYYKVSPKMDWSLGYQYRSSDLSGAARDSEDNFFNVGVRGEFSPKLNGQVRFGYTQRSFDAGGDDDLFGVSGNVNYVYSDKASFQLTLSNDFGSSAVGSSTKNFAVGVSSKTRFSEQLVLDLGLNFRSIDYLATTPARSDDFIEARAGLIYVYSKMLNFDASLTLRNNDSSLASAEFSNNVISFGANVRY